MPRRSRLPPPAGPRRSVAICVVLVLSAWLLAVWLSRADEDGVAEPVSDAPVAAGVDGDPRLATEVPNPAPAARTPASAARSDVAWPWCAMQHVDIGGSGVFDSASGSVGTAMRACLAKTRTTQSGDLRSYLLDADDASGWTLRIEAAAGAPYAVILSSPDRGEFRCGVESGEARCAGVVMEPRDRSGGRRITLHHVPLRRVAGGAAPGEAPRIDPNGATLIASAVLQTEGDEQEPSLACAGAAIAIVQAGGGGLTFCPASGSSVALTDDGRRVFTLRGLEGDNLIVGIDAAGNVDHVEFGNAGCEGAACAGATTTPPPEGTAEGNESGRTFTFAGTVLWRGGRSAAAVTLAGGTVLPEM